MKDASLVIAVVLIVVLVGGAFLLWPRVSARIGRAVDPIDDSFDAAVERRAARNPERSAEAMAAMVVTIAGAVAVIVAVFLPLVDETGLLAVGNNSPIEGGAGRWLPMFAFALAAIYCAVAAYTAESVSWLAIPLGLLGLVAVVLLSQSGAANLEAAGGGKIDVTNDMLGPSWYVAAGGALVVAVGGLLAVLADSRSPERSVATTDSPASAMTEEADQSAPPAPGTPGERPMKRCPACAEDVYEEATICRYCRHEFTADTTPQR